MSAAAVIPAPRVVGTIIWPKASVAGCTSFPLNPTISIVGLREILFGLRAGEVGGIPGVGAKSYNPRRTTSGEGGRLEHA